MIIATQSDPFQPYGSAKKHPNVPEPATYGFLLMAFVLIFIGLRRRQK